MKKIIQNFRDADWETIGYFFWYCLLMIFLIAFTGGIGKNK